jgi:glutaredoxin
MPSPNRPRLAPLVACLLLGLAAGAHAQYKVVSPDGKITYTDRAPAPEQGRVLTVNGRTAASAPDIDLPYELREPAKRYPVTLYVAPSGCEPCDSARGMLRKRGVPYSEHVVSGPEDAEALERLSGSREAPTLTIGSQVVRGYAPELWSSYLDAAGYPHDSKLPTSYAYKPATPVVERPPIASAKPAPPAAAPEAPRLPPVNAGTIRF